MTKTPTIRKPLHSPGLTQRNELTDACNAMPRPCFTVEQARAAGQRSAQLRAERKLNPPPITPIATQEASTNADATLSQYAKELMHAQAELLHELRETPSAKDKAALSQAIKNLREAWHMETGKPKPGTIKPERQSSRQQVKQPSEPKLDTTTDSGSAQ